MDRVLTVPESTSKFHEDVSQISTVFTPITLSYSSQHAPMDLWGVSYDHFTREEKFQAQFTKSSTRYASITPKWTAVSQWLLSGTSLKDDGEEKSSQQAKLGAVQLFVHFVWTKKWPDVHLHADSWDVVNCLAQQPGTWKEHVCKTGDKKIWDRGMQICLSKWAKSVKIFVFHVNSHQRVISVEEDF